MQHTGPVASPPVATGTYLDGLSARAHPVTLRLADRLEIDGAGTRLAWDLADLAAGDTVPPLVRIGPRGSPARVEFADPGFADALAGRCPDLYRSDAAGAGGTWRLVLWSVAAGVSVLVLAIYGVPVIAGRLAPLVPNAIETRLGGTVEGQVGRLLGDPPVCDEPAARAVLDRLVRRMTRGGDIQGGDIQGTNLPGEPLVSVRRHPLANALTLPGARVLVLSDLIDKAESPDEFAGILAHELGHVAAHDPMRALLAAGGSSFLLSLVLGDLTGSTILIATGQAAISAGYSREAENAADAYAVTLMRRAGGDAAALATILERISGDGDQGRVATFLRSHPMTRERAQRIRTLAGPGSAGRQILTGADWTLLKGICRNVPVKPAQ